MKITIGDLRRLIRESMDDESDWIPEKSMFYSILRNLADNNGGYLQVTHESPASNKESIDKSGLQLQPRSHGIYFTVGWYDSPVWVNGDGLMVRVTIPKRYLVERFVIPDDRFGSGDDGYREFMDEFPDVVGGEIGTQIFRTIPRGWIKEIIEV